VKKLVIAKRASQFFFLCLFVYILWSTTYPLKGLLPADTFFKINPLILFITSLSERKLLTGVYFASGMLYLSLILGRFFCGWVCPLGAIIDLCGAIRKKGGLSEYLDGFKPHYIKYFILAIISIFALIGIQAAWIFDPMVIMARFVSLNLIPSITYLMNSFFIVIIKYFNIGGPIYDFYRSLKGSILGINIYYFSNSFVIFVFFLFICATTFFAARFWCRSACPLGALYALISKKALLTRVVKECEACGKCISCCRMGAIKDGKNYDKSECILCMDCVYDCPEHATQFMFRKHIAPSEHDKKEGISRRSFLMILGSFFFMAGFGKFRWVHKKNCVIRPPASLKEDDFLNRCIRCGNCMKVCITNGLQPAALEAGPRGIWTPRLIPEIGYCEYNCTLCGEVCPTAAIKKLSLNEKRKVKLGTAEIDKSICIAWKDNKECIVCEEHCPIPEKAIKLIGEIADNKRIYKPVVNEYLCTGCGICQNKCPVRPARAIKVNPEIADRL